MSDSSTSPETSTEDEPATLAEALTAAGIELPEEQIEQLDRYRQLLWEWNEKMNLTRHTTLEKFATRDVIDSLELGKQLSKGERVLDVGTGGGVPGVVLAIVRPDLKISLCESVQKKFKAVSAIVAELGLECPVYGSRAEDLLEAMTFDTLIARAVAPLRKMLWWMQERWESFDRLLLIKGRNWPDERGEARHHGLLKDKQLRKVGEYTTPGTDAVSVILEVCPEEAT